MRRTPRRGDGVGIEYTRTVLRGVRFDRDEPDRVHAIAELPIRAPGDELSTVDAFVRLRAELGNPEAPTRIGVFPPGASLQRIDTTGSTGPELNRLRAELEERFGVTSTMLADEGPRRWLITLVWDTDALRTIERLAERAGFTDVAIEPSPVAICRVASAATTWLRRDATDGEAFRLVARAGVPVAAITDDTIGRPHPNLDTRHAPVSFGLFDTHHDAGDLAVLVQRVDDHVAMRDDPHGDLVVGGREYPPYPIHDIRSAQRQCVALGAALGAAGLAGRARPVDVSVVAVPADEADRPWAIERLTDLAPPPSSATAGAIRRAGARVVPRRAGARRTGDGS